MGMEDKTVTIKGNKVQIELRADQKTLDEVVVTGYGVQKKASFTGAASLLNGSQIEKKSDANFVKALEGNVSGIQITTLQVSLVHGVLSMYVDVLLSVQVLSHCM